MFVPGMGNVANFCSSFLVGSLPAPTVCVCGTNTLRISQKKQLNKKSLQGHSPSTTAFGFLSFLAHLQIYFSVIIIRTMNFVLYIFFM